jgi:hypothetical protein
VEKTHWRDALQLTLPKEHGSWSLALALTWRVI